MKNYIDEAKKLNINLSSWKGSSYLETYYINHTAKYVEMRYMNGHRIKESLNDRTKEDFDRRQRADLQLLQEQIDTQTSFTIKKNGIYAGVYTGTGLSLLILLNNIGGIVWLTWAGYFLSKAIKPLSLKKDTQLAGWIYDNREDVNQVIVEEVQSKMIIPEITAETLNKPEVPYPIDQVQYSKKMYEEGIDLNNIHELSNSQLRKLKRKVKAKRRNGKL